MIWRLELIVKIHYEVIADCRWSEALSLANPLRKDLITGWSCHEALYLTNPSPRGVIRDWSCSEALSLTNPSGKGLIGDWSLKLVRSCSTASGPCRCGQMRSVTWPGLAQGELPGQAWLAEPAGLENGNSMVEVISL